MPGLSRSHRKYLNSAAVLIGASSSALAITYAGTQSPAGLGTYSSPMFDSVPIGTAYANRRCLFCIQTVESNNFLAISDVKINGSSVFSSAIIVSGSHASNGNLGNTIIWCWADLSSGTSTTVDVVSTNLDGSGSWACSCYTFDKTAVTQTTPIHYESETTNSADTNTVTTSNSFNSTAGGFIIAALQLDLLKSPGATTHVLSSSTDLITKDMEVDSTARRSLWSKKSNCSAASPWAATWTWTNNSECFCSVLEWW